MAVKNVLCPNHIISPNVDVLQLFVSVSIPGGTIGFLAFVYLPLSSNNFTY